MKFEKIPATTAIISKECAPRFYQGKRQAILLLHGYTGSPHDMQYLADKLIQKEYTVYIPRYPGHGTNQQDFLQSDWRDWLREAIDAYLFLKEQNESVHVCGLSMGGVLTLLLAAKFKIPKICLCAPAIQVKSPIVPFTPVLKYFVRRIKKPHNTYPKPYLQRLQQEYWSEYLLQQLAHLAKLQKMCKKHLPDVTSECLVILAKMDKQVPVEVYDLLKARTKSKNLQQVLLEKSGHVVVNDTEREIVAQQILRWFA